VSRANYETGLGESLRSNRPEFSGGSISWKGRSHGKTEPVLTGGAGAGDPDGPGSPGRSRIAVGGDRIDCEEDRLRGRNESRTLQEVRGMGTERCPLVGGSCLLALGGLGLDHGPLPVVAGQQLSLVTDAEGAVRELVDQRRVPNVVQTFPGSRELECKPLEDHGAVVSHHPFILARKQQP